MTDPRREPPVDEERTDEDLDRDLEDELRDPDDRDEAPGEEPADEDEPDDEYDDRHRHMDFDTFMEEEGEAEGERPGWARRRWSSAALVVATLLGALVVAVATWSWPDTGVRGEPFAEVELVGLSSTVDDALATLSDVDGRRMLRIDASELPDVADGFAQVWVLDRALDRYVPVGILDNETTELWFPATLDLSAYPIIEVSQEPFDGDPAHSGRTLWRGELPEGEPSQA